LYVFGNPVNFVDLSGAFPLRGGIDDLPVVLIDPRSLGYDAGQNVDLLPYLFYLDPYDFSFTASINYSVDNALAERAISILATKFSSIVGQGNIPNLPGDENYPTEFIIEMLEGENYWRRLIDVHGSTQNLFSDWFVVRNVKGKNMVAETFPLNSPENFNDVHTTVYLNPITQGNNKRIILDSDYMRLSFGYTYWLPIRISCISIFYPISFSYTSRLVETDNYYRVDFITEQTGDKTLETRGEIRLLEGFNPAGTLTLRGIYTGPEWKLHVIDHEVAIQRK
jgi:hypothetical protein